MDRTSFSFSRFASLNTEEISTLLSEKESIRTKRARKQYKGIFDEYLHEKQKEYPKNSIELATILKSFYAEARKKTGELYSKSSLCALRFGLSRHFKEHLDVDIVKDKEFEEANQVFFAQCLKLKREGLAKTNQCFDTKNSRTKFDRSGFEARHILSVSGHRSESSLKSYCKTGQNTKEKMADSLMSVIASSSTSSSNAVTRPVENEVSSSLLLTDSQEDFYLRDLTVQTANNNSAKQFNGFYNCKVDFH